MNFLQADIFSDEIEQNLQLQITNHKYDIIVSNPPYICESEKAAMRPNVLNFEPPTALFVSDNDPLRFYRRIAELFTFPLGRDGVGRFLFFEINEAYSVELSAMLSRLGYTDIKIYNDIYGKPRIIQSRMAR